jgi:hypothetical protein
LVSVTKLHSQKSQTSSSSGLFLDIDDLRGLSFEEFNQKIGMPIHPVTNLPAKKLAAYQIALAECEYRDVNVVKSEKIGITETLLRWILWKTVPPDGNCAGYQIMLGAQEERLAKNNLARLLAIFQRSKHPGFRNLISGEPGKTEVKLRNGTYYFVMPRFAGAFQGWDRVKIAFLDEAAHYGLLDDTNILNSAVGRLTNTRGYLRVVSRPSGQRGFFYQRHLRAQQGSRIKEFIFDYTHGIDAGLITQETIDEAREEFGPYFSQHYECEFIGSELAVFPSDLIDSHVGEYSAREL